MSIASGLSWALAGGIAVISCYMLLLVLGAWLSRADRTQAAGQPRFVVVVPAHNEEQGIAHTLRQLLACDYPADRLRIVVIADNCTDRTAASAALPGVHVLERHDLSSRGKGQALGWVLGVHEHLFRDADLIAFIDADMNVHPGFLRAMAGAFSREDVQVAQGRYVVANPGRGVLSAIGFASFCYVNHVRPAGRCFWGGSSDLKGSGMVFRSAFLLPRGWNAHSIAEDIQLGKELLLEGVRVHYVSGAKVDSDIPSTLAQVRVQQARWEGGKRDVLGGLRRRTLDAFMRRPSVALLDGLCDMLVPPLSVIVLLNLAGLALAWWVPSGAAWVHCASLGIFGAAVLTGLLQNRAGPGVYLRLAAAPVFVVWKLLLLSRVLLGPVQTAWNRTPRDPRNQQ